MLMTDKLTMDKPLWLKIGGAALAALLVVMLGLSWYWSRTPDLFWVTKKTEGERTVVGYSTTDTIVRVAETLLDKPGGYLSNDRLPPSVFLDNMPNWEYGVLQQVRDLARVTRNDFSRSQSQSREDPDLAAAEPAFFVDHTSWVLPRPESEYRAALEGFRRYRDRLAGVGQPDAQFFSRADNIYHQYELGALDEDELESLMGMVKSILRLSARNAMRNRVRTSLTVGMVVMGVVA